MEAIDYTTARKTLAATMERVCRDSDPVIITKGGCSVVMMSLADYESLEETDSLLSSPANAARLMRAIESDRKGQKKTVTLAELEKMVNEKTSVHA